MRTIYKYTLSPNNLEIEMPKDAIILTAREQFDNICIWAEVQTNNELEKRYFDVFGTGYEIPVDMGTDREYIGTAVLQGGSLIFHVYENLGI